MIQRIRDAITGRFVQSSAEKCRADTTMRDTMDLKKNRLGKDGLQGGQRHDNRSFRQEKESEKSIQRLRSRRQFIVDLLITAPASFNWVGARWSQFVS